MWLHLWLKNIVTSRLRFPLTHICRQIDLIICVWNDVLAEKRYVHLQVMKLAWQRQHTQLKNNFEGDLNLQIEPKFYLFWFRVLTSNQAPPFKPQPFKWFEIFYFVRCWYCMIAFIGPKKSSEGVNISRFETKPCESIRLHRTINTYKITNCESFICAYVSGAKSFGYPVSRRGLLNSPLTWVVLGCSALCMNGKLNCVWEISKLF